MQRLRVQKLGGGIVETVQKKAAATCSCSTYAGMISAAPEESMGEREVLLKMSIGERTVMIRALVAKEYTRREGKKPQVLGQ